MSKMSIEPARFALNGPTMGTRWSALFYRPPGFDAAPVQAALQAAVDAVDDQMSTWKPDSDLQRLSAAPIGQWIAVSRELRQVLRQGMAIAQSSGGAFDITMGDAVAAWGFGPDPADPARIGALLSTPRPDATTILDFGPQGVRKNGPAAFDLNGIAKGYGVDRLAEVLRNGGISDALVAIDGELRALGLRPDGQPWSIAVETPDHTRRAAHSILALQDAAVATSGDYRHVVHVGGHNLSHTMDPKRGAPLRESPASVTVIARTCAEADAWATALMVLGAREGMEMARRQGLDALFLLRDDAGLIRSLGVGALFAPSPAALPEAKTQQWTEQPTTL
ncbi:MAG: FAD:protein FMN transferase [Paracoccaceae bacterium]